MPTREEITASIDNLRAMTANPPTLSPGEQLRRRLQAERVQIQAQLDKLLDAAKTLDAQIALIPPDHVAKPTN